MKKSEHLHDLVTNTIRNYIRKFWKYEFTSAWDSTRPPHMRKFRKPFNATFYRIIRVDGMF